MKHNTAHTKAHSQSSIIETVKDWLIPEAIKEEKRNQAKTKKSADRALDK